MTETTNGTALELKRIVRMLDRAVEMAQDAALTGSLSERSAAAVRSFNSIVTHLLGTAQISTGLFEPLPADANLTDVAMASAQLAEYLRAGLPEEDQERPEGPQVSRSLIVGNLNLGAGDQDELSEKIREHLAEFFGEAKPGAAAEGAESQPEASASAAPANPAPASGARRAALPSQGRVEEVQAERQSAEARRQ